MPSKSTQILEDQELGKIKVTKYKGAKSIKIRVKEDLNISVTLPYRASFKNAEIFITEKKSWILEQISKFKKQKNQTNLFLSETYNPQDFFSKIQNLKTKFRTLELVCLETIKPCYRLSPSKIKIYYPQEYHTKTQDPNTLINLLKSALEKAFRLEARHYLPQRLSELARQKNLSYRKIFIRSSKTRWGSCSFENNINLSWYLMKLPDELIDYVLLHELAHTKHKNHSREFWSFLGELLGADAKTIDKRLKKYRPDMNLV
jgi:predicted metal-dependent hydrolase